MYAGSLSSSAISSAAVTGFRFLVIINPATYWLLRVSIITIALRQASLPLPSEERSAHLIPAIALIIVHQAS